MMSKPSMKLITIEEPQKAILEPLSEVSESPATPISPPAMQPSPPAVEFTQPSPPAVETSQPTSEATPISKGRHVVTGPPSAELLAQQKQPLMRKKSDKAVKRIRTHSKVETAL